MGASFSPQKAELQGDFLGRLSCFHASYMIYSCGSTECGLIGLKAPAPAPLFCREFMAEDRALSRFWVLSAVPQGPGFAPSCLLPSLRLSFSWGQVPQGDVTLRAPSASKCAPGSESCVGWNSFLSCNGLGVWQESLSSAVSGGEHAPRFQQG